jgi:anti-sigma factor RsiW
MNERDMTCADAESALTDLIFGEPDDRIEALLHEHLRACPRCAAEERALLALRDAGRHHPPAMSPALRARILAAVERAGARPRLFPLARPVPAYVALAAALLGALLVAALPARRAAGPGTPTAERPAGGVPRGEANLSFSVAESFATGVQRPAVTVARDDTGAVASPLQDSL